MPFRQDKLILLLDFGTSPRVRRTAAKQLADLALKIFRAYGPSVKHEEGEVNPEKGEAKPDVSDDRLTLPSGSKEEGWIEVLETIAKILPLLKSRSSETRHAAANALGLLASVLPNKPNSVLELASEPIDLPSLAKSGQTLLASAGREYVAKPAPGDKAKRRKAMMGSLGLSDGVGWGDDLNNVIGDEEEMAVDAGATEKQSEPTAPPQDIFEGLSARQITMLKRKKGNIVQEANKMRKLNAQATGTPASSSSTPAASPDKLDDSAPQTTNTVVVDPGAKARATAAAGGQIEPTESQAPAAPIIPLKPGQAAWAAVFEILAPNLTDPAWQTRHGSALAIMEIIRYTGSSFASPSLLPLARNLLSLLAMDRFGDFVGDTMIAPVRETAAQALGVLLKYLDAQSIREVHETFMGMVRQSWAKRGGAKESGERFAWELRHAGLLGLKYEVAVRPDLLGGLQPGDQDVKPDIDMDGLDLLGDLADAAILALGDVDDDVRTVAASALMPIAPQMATRLPQDQLAKVVHALWDCLKEGGDELGSSTGAVMDLLGEMISHPEIIAIMAEDPIDSEELGRFVKPTQITPSGSRSALISRIYAFVRHPISSVRLAVIKALLLFASTTSDCIDRDDWMRTDHLSLLLQNLMLEERSDIREISLTAFSKELEYLEEGCDLLYAGGFIGDFLRKSVEDWYDMVMTPIGSPLQTKVVIGTSAMGHNVDKPMLAGDMSLISTSMILNTRIAAAKALSGIRLHMEQGGGAADVDRLLQSLTSTSAHQIFVASVILQEWAMAESARMPDRVLGLDHEEGAELAKSLITILTTPRGTYSEMDLYLKRIQGECQALFTAFNVEGNVAKGKIPALPSQMDPLSKGGGHFSLSTAQNAIGEQFDKLATLLPKSATKTVLPSLQVRRRKVTSTIGYFSVMKERYDVQVSAGVAGALIAIRVMPPKLGLVIKGVMDAVKKEESEILQSRAASSVASLVQYCNSPLFTNPVNPCDKVIKNLYTFLCQDVAVTPVFSASTDGIITLLEENSPLQRKGSVKDLPEESEQQMAARVTRRGALEAFKAMAKKFGPDLFEAVPKFWDGISAALIAMCGEGSIDIADARLSNGSTAGQDLVDCLTSLRLVAPELNPALHAQLVSLFSPLLLAMQSTYAVVRNTAARCLAALCDVMTDEGMKRVLDDVVPLVGDAKRAASRQGSVEAIHHIIMTLDIKALPYVPFLIVPILGRMSDPDEPVRLLATSTFASLVKMVPLEAGIPDPPGFSLGLLAKRDEERAFLKQLLDGSGAEQYQIPIPIKAELRQYQRDGVSWLAFLAKYQLHGILCDDMGLGKSLQSICIIGSKHFERAQKHASTNSADTAHLPSLIVCPPTLTGHWYYEIFKFTDYLRPLQYTGNATQRAALRAQIPKHDVIIASYESVRGDIAELGAVDWLYCVLDEGHIIKNAKTKLSAAVKQIRAQHRLLLSGTPIQNNVLELWSLFDFLMPGFLGNERVFNDRFSKPILADRDGRATPKDREIATAALEALHKQVLPFLLRRLKEDVLDDLPPKIIQDYYCELSDVQKQLYDEFAKSRAAEEAGEAVQEGGPGQQHVFQSLQYLRKLCNHPALVLDQEPQRFKSIQTKIGSNLSLRDISHAPKLEALHQLLTDCGIGASDKHEGNIEEYTQHRALIFCQLRPMLDLIERDLFAQLMPTVSYMRMDGSTDPRKRHAVVQRFNNDPRIDVLLLTTSVGGLGLNLTGADTVIFVDHDWNPMKDLQAMDRAHRLGQKKVVNVYRLIMRGTLEEKIMGLQRFKLDIASSVVTQQNAGLGSMNTGEVLDLFKVSADGEPAKVGKTGSGPVSASKVLEGLEDLPPEDEYAGLSLSDFLSKV